MNYSPWVFEVVAPLIPSTTVLRRDHVPKVYEKQLQSLRDNIKDKLVIFIADETTDCRSQYIKCYSCCA